MKRRDFITLIGGAVVVLPRAARAQQAGRMRRIGLLLGSADNPEGRARVNAFQQTLQSLGWSDNRNIQLDVRWTAADADRTRTMAKELVALGPDVLLGEASPTVAALLKETSTLPIVFVNVANPVASGFVANLAHPGGTVTGFTSNEPSMGGKWLQLLKEARPQIRRANFMYNTYSASLFLSAFVQSFEAAAQSLGVEAKQVTVRDGAEIAPAMAEIAQAPDQGVVVMADIFSTVHHAEYIAAANQYRVPAVYPFGFFAKNGGLIGFGADIVTLFRSAAGYCDRILRGGKAADLPVQGATKFELIVNLKTAQASGIELPTSVLLRADNVVE
jgi:putative tryptophan/tyrosine transport system substrate-binding protein